MMLAKGKIFILDNNLLALKAEIKHKPQAATARHEQIQIFATERRHAEYKSSMFGSSEADANVLLQRRDGSLKVISDVIIRSQINTNLIGTNRSLERCPLAVALVTVVLLNACAVVVARTRLTLSNAALGHTIQLGASVLAQLHWITIDHHGTHAANVSFTIVGGGANDEITGQI